MWHRWRKDEFSSLQVGIGGSMVWHRWKYGGWSSDNTVSKVQVLSTFDFGLDFGLGLWLDNIAYFVPKLKPSTEWNLQ